MAKSLAQKMANRRYRDKVYDQITVEVPKGKREEYKQAAEDLQLTFKALIQSGIEEYIANHAGEPFTQQPKPEPLSADERRLLVEFNQLPSDAQKHFLKAFKAINQTKGGGEND